MNCICNTQLTTKQRTNLVSIIKTFTLKRELCKQVKHHTFKSKKRYGGEHYICSICGVVRSKEFYKLHGNYIRT